STAGREAAKPDGAETSAEPTGESGGDGADGATGGADRGGGTVAGQGRSSGGAPYDGTRAPKTPEESIQIAGRELKSSGAADAKGDLASAVRHAARALQAAEAFPKDPKCVVLADAARGRLKALEGKGVSPGDLSRSGPLDTRRIIESP
ncbi:MAG: hypothetical protein C0506_16560, partial [Anaerolinea sp.]|nr:hypothetical protein [Anaerolinea sp.]